jgi:hypothetical protein
MKSSIRNDAIAWFLSFLIIVLLPATSWWKAQAFPPSLSLGALGVALLVGAFWIALRALSRRLASERSAPNLRVGLAVLCPIATALLVWPLLIIEPSLGPRIFGFFALVLAGFGWGLASEVFERFTGDKPSAQA